MRRSACLLLFLLAAPAAGQGQVAPVTSTVAATPRVIRVMWLDFPQPTCAPRIRVAVETAVPQAPVRPAANAVAAERIHPERVLPLANVAALFGGGRVRSCRGQVGFATSALWTKPIQAVLALEPMAGSPLGTFEVDLHATIAGAEPDDSATYRIGPKGVDLDYGGRAAIHFVGEHQLFAFVAIVPAAVAARLPVGELDSWRAHALEALRRSNSPFFRVGEQMGWDINIDDRRWLGAAIAFFALVPARSEAARAALWHARSSDDPEPSPVKAALALADDPRGVCKAYNRGARGPGQFAFLKQILLESRVPHLREQAEHELRHELGEAVIRNDPLLSERLGLRGAASVPPWLVVYLIAVAVAAGLILRPRNDRDDPIHGARRRLVLGGFLLWADPIVQGIDLLPDALGYLCLFVAGQRLRAAAEAAWYPAWVQVALGGGAVSALLVIHTPAPGAIGVVAGVALAAYGVGLTLALARYLGEADKTWSVGAARLALGLIVLSLPFELVLAASGGVSQLDTAVPAPFRQAVWPGLFLMRLGLPALLFAVVMALRPELHAAAQARKAADEIPALERELRPLDRPTLPEH